MMKVRSLTTVLVITGMLTLMIAGCGGGATVGNVIDDPGTTTGSVEGFLFTDGIDTHAASAVDTPVAVAEVWCENAATGQRLGGDTTGSDGSFAVMDLPSGTPLELHFRFGALGGFEDIEGTVPVQLRAGERLQMQQRIRQHDADQDGVCERVENGGTDPQLQIRLRERRENSGIPDLPAELDGLVEDWDSLPLIPYDDDPADETRDASAIDGVPFSVTGLEYLRQKNSTELEDALYVGDTETRFSWAFYEIDGFVDQDIESLTLACTPDEGGEYYIGISNFRSQRWEWSGPVTVADYVFEVNTDFRHVSCNGSLYFMVIAAGENGATMYSAFATPRDVEPIEPPAPPAGMTLITGTVLDDAGEPLGRHLHLEVSNSERSKYARVHYNGNFRLMLPEGTFTITPLNRGYTFVPESSELVLPSEEEIFLEFVGTIITE